MTYTWADAIKDFLGAVGPLLIAVPWFYDFSARLNRKRFSEIRAVGSLAKLKLELEASLKEKIESPKLRDFVWTILGLLCIATSFFIAFVHGLSDLGHPSTPLEEKSAPH
jgi:hypothetical protein